MNRGGATKKERKIRQMQNKVSIQIGSLAAATDGDYDFDAQKASNRTILDYLFLYRSLSDFHVDRSFEIENTQRCGELNIQTALCIYVL